MVLYIGGACAHESAIIDVLVQRLRHPGRCPLQREPGGLYLQHFKPNGAGHSHTWSADVDSLIAGQVNANLTPQLSAVLQVIAEQNYDNSYRPHVEWANIKYQVTPEFSVRAGRTLLPTFLFSDTRKVAYAYPWVRPPLEVYRQEPITASDGVDASYQIRIGDIMNILRARLRKRRKQTYRPAGSIKWKTVGPVLYRRIQRRYPAHRLRIKPHNSG